MTSGTPKQYSVNFGEAIVDTWEFYKNRYFPRVKDNNVFIGELTLCGEEGVLALCDEVAVLTLCGRLLVLSLIDGFT
jgi:hypothetical protein